MHIKNLTIQGFRSIKKLQAKDAKRVNFLVGKNNSGKTSVLEAIFLMCGPTNPQLTLNIHQFRDLLLTQDEDFRFLFNELDSSKDLKINTESDNRELRQLTIKPQMKKIVEDSQKEISTLEMSTSGANVSSQGSTKINGINLEFQIAKRNTAGKATNQSTHKSSVSIRDNRVVTAKDYVEQGKCVFQSNKTVVVGIEQRFSNLQIQKKTSAIVRILKSVDPSIVDLRMGANGLIWCDLGYSRMLPLNIMGDGVRRILSLILAISDVQDGIILIDEIENGFHFGTLSIALKALIAASYEYNVQIFATTHSYECLKALQENLINFTHNDDIRVFRIERTGSEHDVVTFDQLTFSESLASEWEIR